MMKTIKTQLAFGLLCLSFTSCASKEINPWKSLLTPSSDAPEAIGTYTAGCLKGAASLYPDGLGYKVMRISRRRFYAHPTLIQFVESIGHEVKEFNLGMILVGDLTQPRGGPNFPGHGSHQIGLDGDFWYLLPSKPELTLDDRETLSALNVVKKEGHGLSDAWGDREREILKLAASHEEVERIFVSPWIKKDLCDRFKGKDWLGKIRPWWGHEDHFHVRLKCPLSNTKCVKQAPIPSGDGCDNTLDWWFSEEAKAEGSKAKSAESTIPPLPPDCEKMINGS